MRSNLTISSAITLISIKSVSMISGSRIAPLAWHRVDIIERSVDPSADTSPSQIRYSYTKPLLSREVQLFPELEASLNQSVGGDVELALECHFAIPDLVDSRAQPVWERKPS
jgi:hypothetical protein